MVRRIPIRAKVAGALAVPLVGLVAIAGVGVSTYDAEARSVTRQAELAAASIGHAGLIGALQSERDLAYLELLGLGDGINLEVGDHATARDVSADRATAREATDDAATQLRHEITGQQGALRDDYGDALSSLDELASLRARVDAGLETPGLVNRDAAHALFTSYSAMVATLFEAHDRFALVVDDAGLRQSDELVQYTSRATDAVGQLAQRLIHLGTSPGGIDQPSEVAEIAALRRDVDRTNAVIELKSTADHQAAAEDLLANARVVGLPALAADAIETGGPVDPWAVLSATPLGPEGGYSGFREDVVGVLDARADELRAEAEARRRWYLGGGVVVVAAAVLIAWLVTRSITRPLRDLSVKARQMATYRLPTAVQDILDAPSGEDLVIPEAVPITVRARDEVGDVAGALNDVQSAAIGLAVEQAALRRNVAESYVNLGRRNQNLLSRLLDVVGDLERSETDPERTARLYKLDHLATRIRRNAESLLVLSQPEGGSAWQPPVQIADVVRAALGEIENYERVLVRTLDPALVLGGASADLAHLLAELIENGLRHSPPRELVEVSGQVRAGGYVLNIIDHGLGMAPDDIERANQRLAGTESFTVTPAKYLGHYVTAVLAARHQIRVRLQGTVVVGIAAVVELPVALIVERGTGEHLPDAAANGADGAGTPPADRRGVGESPSPDDVRSAVALIHPRSSAPPATVPVVVAPAVEPDPEPATSTELVPVSLWARPVSPSRAEVAGGVVRALPAGPASSPSPVADDAAASATTATGPAATGAAATGATAEAPTRTASGLVRRVRGAHVPPALAKAATEADEPAPTPAPAGPPIDAEEYQRFLTNLVGGVQRSLEGNGVVGTPDARSDDGH